MKYKIFVSGVQKELKKEKDLSKKTLRNKRSSMRCFQRIRLTSISIKTGPSF